MHTCGTMISIMICLIIIPDSTKCEMEKHRKLVVEHKERHSRGESGLIIWIGAVVARPPCPDNQSPAAAERTNYSIQLSWWSLYNADQF